MAINVNTVYQTVLLILNKEQRGYLTPVEFNKIGAQAQLEIFENYFDSLNQQIRIPQTNEDYADRIVNLDEKISIFKTSGLATYVNGVFNLPTTSGATTITDNIIVPVYANPVSPSPISYTISGITATQLSEGTPIVAVNGLRKATDYNIIGNTLTFTNNSQPLPSWTNVAVNAQTTASNTFVVANASGLAGSSLTVGGKVTGATTTGTPSIVTTTNTTPYTVVLDSVQSYAAGALLSITNNITVQVTAQDFYRLGTVRYSAGGNISINELQRVTRSELYHLLSSNLTKPNTTYPIYTYENNQLTVYPSTIQSGINVDYLRKPIEPKWNFTSSAAANYTYIYDATTSVNFELHPSDQTELILKTLLYAGVVIEDPTVIQVAAQQVALENQNQKS
jgi:hypothetical protein